MINVGIAGQVLDLVGSLKHQVLGLVGHLERFQIILRHRIVHVGHVTILRCHEAGLRRLNVHLDTLDRECFLQIARRDDLDRVLEGLQAAKRAGFSNIKLNAVAVKGLVEPDIVPLARYARSNGFEARFIEFMPLDAQNLWDRSRVLLADDIIAMLSREISPLTPVPDPDPRAPASEYEYADGGGRVV